MAAVEAIPQAHTFYLAAIRLAVRNPIRIVRDGRTVDADPTLSRRLVRQAIRPALREKTRQRGILRQRRYRQKYKARYAAYKRAWYVEHREQHIASVQAWRDKNRERRNTYERDRRRLKRALEKRSTRGGLAPFSGAPTRSSGRGLAAPP